MRLVPSNLHPTNIPTAQVTSTIPALPPQFPLILIPTLHITTLPPSRVIPPQPCRLQPQQYLHALMAAVIRPSQQRTQQRLPIHRFQTLPPLQYRHTRTTTQPPSPPPPPPRFPLSVMIHHPHLLQILRLRRLRQVIRNTLTPHLPRSRRTQPLIRRSTPTPPILRRQLLPRPILGRSLPVEQGE